MSLTVKSIVGSVSVNGTVLSVGNSVVTNGSQYDFVGLGGSSQAQIYDGTESNGGLTLAATVSTSSTQPQTTVQTNSPPTQSVYPTYYNLSSRWQLKCPGGSIGVRM